MVGKIQFTNSPIQYVFTFFCIIYLYIQISCNAILTFEKINAKDKKYKGIPWWKDIIKRN